MTVWIQSPFDNLPAEGFRKQRYWLMAEAFARAGHAVVYWTSDFNHGTKARRVLRPASADSIGIRVELVPTLPYVRNVCWARVRSHRAYAREWTRRAAQLPKPDVIITATPTLSAAEAGRAWARRVGAMFVVDVQDAWPETFGRLLPSCLRGLAPLLFAPMYRTARRLYADADAVTGVSARYRAITGRDDYHLAYHGIAAAQPPTRTAEQPSAPRLVYVGNLGEGYDLGTVLRAVAEEPTWTLDVAGRGPREEMWRQMATTLGVASRVRFHGYLGEGALRKLLGACTVGVIPMRDDSWVGLPYKLGDYLAAGLRVVSSLTGETQDLLTRHRCGACYAGGDAKRFRQAVAQAQNLPPAKLPPELNAETIYTAYVRHVCDVCRPLA